MRRTITGNVRVNSDIIINARIMCQLYINHSIINVRVKFTPATKIRFYINLCKQ